MLHMRHEHCLAAGCCNPLKQERGFYGLRTREGWSCSAHLRHDARKLDCGERVAAELPEAALLCAGHVLVVQPQRDLLDCKGRQSVWCLIRPNVPRLDVKQYTLFTHLQSSTEAARWAV